MAVPSPDDRPGLTARERAELARIERELTADRSLASVMSQHPTAVRRVGRLRSPVSILQAIVLVAILVVLCAATLLPMELLALVLPLLTLATVAPWVLWAAWPSGDRSYEPAADATTTRSTTA